MLEVPPVETEERETTLDQISSGWEEGGLGGAITGGLRGLGQMMLPQSGLPGQRGLDALLNDIVEYSPIGDAKDIAAAVDPDSGLDPLERILAALPIVGAAGITGRMVYKKQAARFDNALSKQAYAASMMPPPGESYDLTSTFEDLGGATPDPTQARKQRALFERRAIEKDSPFIQSTLAAENWDELNALSGVRLGLPQELGAAVVAAAKDPSIYGEGEAARFVAAQVAISKWKRAEQLGMVDPLEQDTDIDRMRDFEVMTTSMGLGPDLVMGTPARLGVLRYDAETQEPFMLYGLVDEILPTERLYDWNEYRPYDAKAVKARMGAIDYESVMGLGASNTARGLTEGARLDTDGGGTLWNTDKTQWYRRMNLSARALSETAGISVKQASGVLSTLSASTKWVPNNLVGAIHVILQTNRPDLLPGTPEYAKAFHAATIGAGWGPDLLEASSAKNKKIFSTSPDPAQAASDFYADPANVTSPAGNITGLDNPTKNQKVELILKANLPPWLVLRMMKTNTFHLLGTDPSLADLATIDVHNDRGFFGTAWIDNPDNSPLAHTGTTKVTRGKIVADETYTDPITGEEVSGTEIIERLDSMKDHGWSKAQIERWKSTLATFPNQRQLSRYMTQQRALQLVRDEFGLDTANEVQAGSWGEFQSMDVGRIQKKLKGAKTVDEIQELASQVTFDSTIYSIVEGNPSMERTAAGYVAEASPTLKGANPSLADLEAAVAAAQRPGSNPVSVSIVTRAAADGTLVPYADLSGAGVRETLRHATPSGMRVGRFERFIANSALKVKSVQGRIAGASKYLREDGRAAAGFAVTAFDPASQGHPGMLPGNRLVLLVPQDRVGDVNAILESQAIVDHSTTQVQAQRLAASRNKVRLKDLKGLTPAQTGELLNSVDWYAISSNDMAALKADLEAAGGQAIPMSGVYGDDVYQPVAVRHSELESVANRYLADAGLDPLGDRFERTQLDIEGGAARGDIYEAADEYNMTPEVIESYDAFKAETLRQYEFLLEEGYTFTWKGDLAEMDAHEVHQAVLNDKHLEVFGSREGFGENTEWEAAKATNPLLEDTPYTNDLGDGRVLTYNDIFRAVHDVFGHSMHEYDFSALGEENAWRSHAAMYSDTAKPAMSSETRMQNSWQNFGPHLRDSEGRPTYGTDQISPDRPFPDQKVGTAPMEHASVDNPNQPSIFVSGLDADTVMRIARKHNQKAVASRVGMLMTDGSYSPTTGKIRFGDEVDATSHSVLPNGVKFSVDYAFEDATQLPDVVDSLSDTGPTAEAMAQVVVDLDGLHGGVNWNVTDRLIKELGAIPGARPRLYTHAPNQVPAGFSQATESVFTDEVGATGSILHRKGDTYARHHADVWIPDWEILTLSQDGFGAERARRNAVQARSILDMNQETGEITLDGDLTIVTNPDHDVTLDADGPIFKSLRVNGQKVTELLIDTSSGHPVMMVGGGVPAPGRTVVQLSNGRVTNINPHAETDLAGARDALASAGLIPDGKDVKVTYPETQVGTLNKDSVIIRWESDDLPQLQKARRRVPTTPEDDALAQKLVDRLGDGPRVRMGTNVGPDIHRQMERVLVGLHEGGLPGSDVVGPIPTSVWHGTKGITTLDIMDSPHLAAVTTMETRDAGIIFNEGMFPVTWNHGGPGLDPGYLVGSDSFTDFETTLIHEMGHLVARQLPDFEADLLAGGFMSQVGGRTAAKTILSKYAIVGGGHELIAEAFTSVMTQGANAHPAVITLVKRVINATH